MILEGLKHIQYNLKNAPKELITPEIALAAVTRNGCLLEDIPKKLITQELVDIAVRKTLCSIKYVPKQFVTKELVNYILTQLPTE